MSAWFVEISRRILCFAAMTMFVVGIGGYLMDCLSKNDGLIIAGIFVVSVGLEVILELKVGKRSRKYE